MKSALMLAVVCFSFGSSALSQQAPYRLTPSDKAFAVSFPTEPKHEQNVADSGGFRVESHAYSCETSEYKFLLSYSQLTPPATGLQPKDALDSAISGTVENVRGKLVTQQEVTWKGKPAKIVTITVGTNTIIDGRFVYAKPRVYQLLVLHHRTGKPQFEQQFFDSFKLTQ